MAKLALYQKYRSSTFEEVVGQEYIVRSIKNAVHENKVGHAYLFCGPRGTGKTTMARLLAKSVNCEHPQSAPCGTCENCIAANNGTHPDIVEINAANETHVEDIRELIERSTLAPMQGKHKVYIIDEVHQLSSAASSALLKTLEEPPENVIFILATTDPQKLLPTIISRCQRFDFTKVRKDQIRDHLLDIAGKENIHMEEKAAMMIAELSDGGMRDALSIMDQCASYTSDDITAEAIDRIYGLTSTSEKIQLLKDIFQKDLASILKRVGNYEEKGIDLARFTDGLIDICKDAVIYERTKSEELLKVCSAEEAKEILSLTNASSCMHVCEKLLDAKARFKVSTSAARVFEVTCLSLTTEEKAQPIVTDHPAVEIRKEIPVIHQEAKPAVEEVVPVKPVVSISEEQVLGILVQCDKGSKISDENTFAMLESYQTLQNRKYTSILKETKIAASGKDCILLISAQPSIVNRINDPSMNKELYFFMRDTMHTDKMLYAISKAEYDHATNAFRSAMKANTLPSPFKIEKYQEAIKEEDSAIEKVKAFFGEENVEVI